MHSVTTGRVSVWLALACLLLSDVIVASDAPELVLNYRFDEGSSTAVNDSGSWKLDGTLNGASGAWVVGKWGQAIDLTGAETVTPNSGNSAHLNLPQLTLSAWINLDAGSTGVQTIASKFVAGSGGYALQVDTDTGELLASARIGGSDVSSRGNTVIADTTWTHVAMSYDGSDLTLYVDGVAQTGGQSVSGAIASSTADLTIGSLFEGKIDELQIHARAFSAVEVAANYAAIAGNPDLLFYEPFDSYGTPINNGVALEAGTISTAASPLGGGLLLDANSIVSFPSLGNINMDKGTISFWLQPNWNGDGSTPKPLFELINGTTNELFIRKVNWNTNDYLIASHNDDPSQPWFSQILSTNMDPSNPIESWLSGEWHFVELHWDATANSPYLVMTIDGNQIAQARPIALNSDLSPAVRFFLGAADLSKGMDAVIDDLRIYGTPQLSADTPHTRLTANTRNDGTWDIYETVANSPDAGVLDTAIATGTDVVFFEKPPYETVYESTQPTAGEVRTSMTYQAAKGDTLSLFLNVHSRVDMGETVISIDGNSLSNGGTTLPVTPGAPEEILDIRVVRNWWQAGEADWSPRNTTWGEYMPELIVNDDTATIDISGWSPAEEVGPDILPVADDLPSFDLGTPAVVDAKTVITRHSTKQIVITIEIPENATAGNYTGNVSLEGQGISADLPITLQVLDFVLAPNAKETMIYHRAVRNSESCYSTYSGTTYTPAEYCYELVSGARYQAQLDDIAAHGFNGIYTYNDPANQADADNLVQQIIDAGFTRRIAFGLNHPQENWDNYSEEAARAMYEQGLTPTFMSVDEPGLRDLLGRHLEDVNKIQLLEIDDPLNPGNLINAGAVAAVALFPNVAECLRDGGVNPDAINGGCESQTVLDNLLPTKSHVPAAPDCSDLDANGDPVCTPPYYPQLAIENIQTEENSTSNRQYYEDLMNGVITPPSYQTYYWQSRVEDPRINRYYAGYFFNLTGVDGYFPYVYHQYDRLINPYNDYAERVNMTTYPSQDGPVATMQWEALRDGFNDNRYLDTWRAIHAQMETLNPSLAAASAATIDAAMAKYKLGRWSVMDNVDISEFAADRAVIQQEILTLLASDQDGDTLTDLDEANATPVTDHLSGDTDSDGLADNLELFEGTDPTNPDTDGEGLSDGDEVNVHGTDPLNINSDTDWLNDYAEVVTHGTDPLLWDTDGDTLPDQEVFFCNTDPLDADSDDDGLSDGVEIPGCQLPFVTDPNNPDTDGDNLLDGAEVNGSPATDPNNQDTDSDGLRDDLELAAGTNPTVPDTDGDGTNDGPDNCKVLSNPSQTDTDSDGDGDACDTDDDNDGVADGVDNCPLDANASQSDVDGDGLGDACDAVTSPPAVSTVQPGQLSRNSTTVVRVTGSAFQVGATVSISPSSRVSVDQVTRIDFQNLDVTISVQQNAKKNFRDLTVTNPDSQSDVANNAIQIVN